MTPTLIRWRTAAELLGVTEHGLQRLCDAGVVRRTDVGVLRMVVRSSLDDYRRRIGAVPTREEAIVGS